jgi:hypothetical protein
LHARLEKAHRSASAAHRCGSESASGFAARAGTLAERPFAHLTGTAADAAASIGRRAAPIAAADLSFRAARASAHDARAFARRRVGVDGDDVCRNRVARPVEGGGIDCAIVRIGGLSRTAAARGLEENSGEAAEENRRAERGHTLCYQHAMARFKTLGVG